MYYTLAGWATKTEVPQVLIQEILSPDEAALDTFTEEDLQN